MNSKLFPNLIVDGFLDEPEKLVDFANTLDYYYDTKNRWPGKRSLSLHEIDKDLFVFLGNKIMNCYNLEKPFRWHADAYFQIVDERYEEGWIHQDDSCVLTTILYLNKNFNINSGTSLYNPKKMEDQSIFIEKKEEYHAKMSKEIQYKMTDEYKEYMKKNNSQFEETITVKNIYNRLFSFEGLSFHGANEFSNEEPRLTMVYFFSEIQVSKNNYPMLKINGKN